jgi:predicted histidine transporter YuiF (NhaC family)
VNNVNSPTSSDSTTTIVIVVVVLAVCCLLGAVLGFVIWRKTRESKQEAVDAKAGDDELLEDGNATPLTPVSRPSDLHVSIEDAESAGCTQHFVFFFAYTF